MHDVLEILYKYGQTESTPWIAEQINELHVKYWGSTMDYSELKKQYNDLLLEKEAGLEELIRKASDPVKECIKYVCAGNYIDFSAVGNVNEETFDLLLEKVECCHCNEFSFDISFYNLWQDGWRSTFK